MKPHHHQGNITEKMFELEMLRREIDCAEPIAIKNYDYLVITKSGEYKKVQVKTTNYSYRNNGSYEIGLKSDNKKAGDRYHDIDIFSFYAKPIDKWVHISFDKVPSKFQVKESLDSNWEIFD